jgi:DNA-binding transcriptional ArsR family regulator
MISYRLTADDLAEMRFGCSPLHETVTSLWALRRPERYVLHLPWIQQTRAALAGLAPADIAVLRALLGGHRGWLPDFVSPRPATPLAELTLELAELAAVDPVRAERDVQVLGGPALPAPAALAAVLARYAAVAIEPHWSRMRGVLEADLLYRARLAARDGAAAMLTGLDSRAGWADGTLTLFAGQAHEFDVDVAGRGLWLMPGLFVPQTITPVSADEPPAVSYLARGVGTLWEAVTPRGPAALVALLGSARAGLLAGLDAPASTTELARRHGVTPSAISQHLTVLRNAGLVSAARAGRHVLYGRTALGDQLIG